MLIVKVVALVGLQAVLVIIVMAVVMVSIMVVAVALVMDVDIDIEVHGVLAQVVRVAVYYDVNVAPTVVVGI